MSESTRREESGSGRYPTKMLTSLSLSWAFLQAGRFVFSPLLPWIVFDLAIMTVTAGFALTLLQAVYAGVQYPSGQWSDRMGCP